MNPKSKKQSGGVHRGCRGPRGLAVAFLLLAAAAAAPCDTAAAQAGEAGAPITVTTTSLLHGPAEAPSAVIEVRLARALRGSETIRVRLAEGDADVFNARPAVNAVGEVVRVRVPLPAAATGVDVLVAVVLDTGDRIHEQRLRVDRPDAGWTVHFIPGFHYDPVWWNTQAHYTETGYRLGSEVGPGLTLVEEYLRKLREDADYKVALHQLPYLKSFVEARPAQVGELLDRVREKRVSIVGGTYNELSTTLISAEATARNAIYGTLFQTETLGGDGRVFWQCDVFGHDPSFPAIMRATGHNAGAFARGPFHQWGAPRDQVNFPSEFLWMSPDGSFILTHYMTGHYGYAYAPLAVGANTASLDPARWEETVIRMFEDLKRPALTHHVMLPMHMDFIRPLENLGDVVRWWNDNYLSPKAVISTPEAYFAAVRGEIQRRDLVVPVITRDMNPIYTGCQVSFADLKTANRACESRLYEAELLATLATLEGAPYPALGLDRAWRQLMFGAHHDGITGSMSDQVYVDMLYAYRDALDIATKIREGALTYLMSRVTPGERDNETCTWNLTGTTRSGVTDLKPGEFEFRQENVPGVGYRCAPEQGKTYRTDRDFGPQFPKLENDHFLVRIDLDKGGAIVSLFDKKLQREWLAAPANDVVILGEYSSLPGHGEGPWHLATTGERANGLGLTAKIVAEGGPTIPTLTIEAKDPLFTKRQTYTLVGGRLDMTTEILDWKGSDMMLRVEFPIDLPGARPVHQTAAAVIGRPFARDGDAAKEPWSLDQAVYQWVGLGTVCALEVMEGEDVVHRRALGVGEIVVDPQGPRLLLEAANRLAVALVKSGVTTTITGMDDRRYGDLALDSNVPDFRVVIGASAAGAMKVVLPEGTPKGFVSWIERSRDLPLLVASDEEGLSGIIEQLESDHRIRLPAQSAAVAARSVGPALGMALMNQGSVSARITADGTMALNLLRSSTGWPAGVWIDEPGRRLPDGAAFETMHGSHVFHYSLLPHEGDFRSAGLSRIAQELHHPLISRPRPTAPNSDPREPLPAAMSFVEIDNPDVLLMAMKPEGFAEARWANVAPRPDSAGEPPKAVVLRLWNSAGRRVETNVKLHHLSGGAWRANLLEERGEALPITDGAIRVKLEPHAIETIICEVRAKPEPSTVKHYDPVLGDVTPSAYWLENRGEGVTGNGLISVAPARRLLVLEDGRAWTPVRIVNNHRTEDAIVDFAAERPPGYQCYVDTTPFALDLAEHPMHEANGRLRIPPGGAAEVALGIVDPMPNQWAGSDRPSMATLIVRSQYPWQTTTTVWIDRTGGPPATSAGHDGPSTTPEVDAHCSPGIMTGDGTITGFLLNRTDGAITGEAAFLAPHALWPTMSQWRERITLPPGEAVAINTTLRGALPSWVMLRFTYGGRIAYSEPVAIVRDEQTVLMKFNVGRVRLHEGEATRVSLNAMSVAGWTDEAEISLVTPDGWQAVEVGRTPLRSGDRTTQLALTYDVTPAAGSPLRGSVKAVGPGGAAAQVEAVVAPRQTARPGAAAITVDGDLSEWAAEEFTQARGSLGRMRVAVRHGADGLVIAAEVDDAQFHQPHTGAGIWQGDSLQFGLSAAASTTPGFTQRDCEFGVTKTDDGPMVWCWTAAHGGATGLVGDARAAVMTSGGKTRYEVFLPAGAMPAISLAPGGVLGWSYVANCNDGTQFVGAIAWTPGLSGSKDPSMFGELRLLGE
jgi:hypothetical protein